MFEFDKYDRRHHTKPPHVPATSYYPVRNINRLSLLVWQEHCIECAAPDCYSTCDLFEKRPDSRCRRFDYGIYKNKAFPSYRGYGAQISFKKWAKIETRGNAAMRPVEQIRRIEHLIEFLSPTVNLIGKGINLITTDSRWAHLTHSLLEKWVRYANRSKNSRDHAPDAFLLEVYNPQKEPVNVQITMCLSGEGNSTVTRQLVLETAFRRTVSLAPGYSRHELDEASFRGVLSANRPFDISVTPEADTHPTLVILTADFASFGPEASAHSDKPAIKCVVFDLDNTLWDGVLLEDQALALRPGILDLLRELDQRGILLSIASKNDHDHAWQHLHKFGIAEYFLYPQINWQPKSTSIQVIAKKLNLGLDTFALIDDNPFELDEVNSTLPSVLTINAADDMLDRPRFAGSHSVDASNRRIYYKDEIHRENEKARFGEDYFGFLRDCDIHLQIDSYRPQHLQRIPELVQRTNQLNFSGRKYSRGELEQLLARDDLKKYVLSCKDKYGSYGVVGFGLVSQTPEELRIEDFMLSCRVQGKFIEQAFFNYLYHHQNPLQVRQLRVNYLPTARNKPALQVLSSLNFVSSRDNNGMILDLTENSLSCNFIQVAHDTILQPDSIG